MMEQNLALRSREALHQCPYPALLLRMGAAERRNARVPVLNHSCQSRHLSGLTEEIWDVAASAGDHRHPTADPSFPSFAGKGGDEEERVCEMREGEKE